MRAVILLLLSLATLSGYALADPVTYSVLVDTSSLAGATGSLDFNFQQGPFNARSATTQILRFGGGVPTGGPSLSGDVSGALPGDLTLGNDMGFNDYFQTFTFGSSLSFDIALNGPALTPSSANTSGSTLAFSIFSDTDGTVPALTSDRINGYAITVDINPDGSTTLRNYTSQITAVTPEPSSAVLLATALFMAGLASIKARNERISVRESTLGSSC